MKLMWVVVLVTVLFMSLPVSAQPVISAKSGMVNYVEGKVYLADKLLELQPAQFPEVKENSVMRTEEGRAEVLLTPGVVLRMGENTSFKMLTNRLIDTRLELLTGSAVVVAMEMAKDTNVTFVYKDSSVTLSKAGIYRFDAEPGRVKVFKGAADVKTGATVVAVASGKMLTLTGTVAVAEKFNTELTDSLDHWAHRRDELMALSNVSAANQARKSYGVNPCAGSRSMMMNLGSWGYNPYYGFGTYIPCRGTLNSPYGYRYWSSMAVYQAFFAPRPVYTNHDYGSMGGGGYNTVAPSSGGYSGAVSSSGSGGSAPSAAAAPSSGSSSAASSGSSAVGGGSSGGGGGRGH